MNEFVGTRLRQAREQRRLTLQQVSESTKVRTHYLQALENDDLSAMPSTAQARGFLRLYAESLGLNVDELSASLSSLEAGVVQEAQPVAPVAAPKPALPTVDVPPSKPLRPGLLATLRDRLRHAGNVVADDLQPATIAAQAAVPGQASLSAEPIRSVNADPQPTAEAGQLSVHEAKPAPDSDGTSGPLRNAGTSPRKSPAGAGEQKADVKKNASKQPLLTNR